MHVREVFVEAVEAYSNWSPGQSEPTVFFENDVDGESAHITISAACELVETCQSPLPKSSAETLRFVDIEPKDRTFAGAATAMLKAIRTMRQAQ
jgi:hypothetical protein